MKTLLLTTVAAMAISTAAFAENHTATVDADAAVSADVNTDAADVSTEAEAAVDATADAATDAADATMDAASDAADATADAASDAADATADAVEGAADATADAAADMTADTSAAVDADGSVATEGAMMADMEGWTEITTEVTAEMLLGADVRAINDDDIGDVGDIVVAEDGTITDVIVDVGGFLGIGEKPVAVSFDMVTIVKEDGGDDIRVYVDTTADALNAMPAYEKM